MTGRVIHGDALIEIPKLPPRSVDLVFGSPPYEDARTYGIGFKLKGQDWVDWMVQVYLASLRVCTGLVAFVVEGRTRNFSYSGTPLLLGADLLRAGVTLRKPPAYERDGISGSGGPDFWKNRYEFVVCATNGGRLPWSDNTAMGHPPKCKPGGPCSHRKKDGTRVRRKYTPPEIANPGNIINCGAGGGGNIGSNIAHKGEAPFPEYLAERFIRSFCPPGGTVLDPFCGTGTTPAVAERCGRNWIAMDLREDQIDLTCRRINEVRGIPPAPVIN